MIDFDINDFRGLTTVIMFLGFIVVSIWAFSRSAKEGFDAMAQLPLEENNDKTEKQS